MSDHARLSPSSRYRWSVCPASVAACAKYEVEGAKSSDSAIDGTHSHTLLEYCLKHAGGIADARHFIGMVLTDHEGMFGINKDRADRVQIALNYIKSKSDGAGIIAEQRVNPEKLLGRNDMGGTVDVQIIRGNHLELIDYKDGMNPVEAKGNKQLEQYAYGVLAERPEAFETITMTIIQPKLAIKGIIPISSHTVDVADLFVAMPDIVAEADATDAPDAPFVPGEAQCKYCPNKGNCSAFNSYTLEASGIKFEKVEFAKEAAQSNPTEMTDDKLREIIEAAPMLRQMIEAAEAEALHRLEAGKVIAGLKVVRGPGRRGWVLPEDDTAARLSKMGVPKPSIWRTVLVSPAQAEKLTWTKRDGTHKQLTEKQLAVLRGEMITKGDGKLTVVPESDRREGITFSAVEEMFGAVPQAGDDLPDWLQ
jgi:hypothetical protein